jgi:hypothetical protein
MSQQEDTEDYFEKHFHFFKVRVDTFMLRPILSRGENHLCVLDRRLGVLLISGRVLERRMFALHCCGFAAFLHTVTVLLTAVTGYLDTVKNINFRQK